MWTELGGLTLNKVADGESMQKSRMDELEQENEQLWRQLHHVQEELERSFLRNQASENPRGPSAQTVAWVDDELLGSVAEVQRLRTILEVQSRVAELVGKASLNLQIS